MARVKRALKQEQILAAAMSLIQKSSYEEVRVEDIAKEAKMAKSMIFYYFTSKAAVYLKILYNLRAALIADYSKELERVEVMDGKEFKDFVIRLTDRFIQEHYLLIGLMEHEDTIIRECERQELIEMDRGVTLLYDNFHGKVLKKVKDFSRMEIAYIFEVQRHFLMGYYRQMISNYNFYNYKSGDLTVERKSLYEFRVVRMLRFFINGILYEKSMINE